MYDWVLVLFVPMGLVYEGSKNLFLSVDSLRRLTPTTALALRSCLRNVPS